MTGLDDWFLATQRDHAVVLPFGSALDRARAQRDADRSALLLAWLATAPELDARQQERAARVLLHGDGRAAARAHELALQAMATRRPARYLAAEAYDRGRMLDGRPQKFGTQSVPDGSGFRLWPCDRATTDSERAKWDVPPLRQLQAAAAARGLTEPAPELQGAPGWLQPWLARWAAGD